MCEEKCVTPLAVPTVVFIRKTNPQILRSFVKVLQAFYGLKEISRISAETLSARGVVGSVGSSPCPDGVGTLHCFSER